MSQIPVIQYGFIRSTLERHGLDVEGAAEGLALARVDPRAVRAKVEWDELARFMERAAGHLSDEELDAIGRSFAEVHTFIRMAVSVLVSPRLVLRMLHRVNPYVFPNIDFVLEEVDDGRVRVGMYLPATCEPSRVFFRATAGEYVAITEALGLGPCGLEMDVGPFHGTYLLTLPEPRTLWHRLAGQGAHLEAVSDSLVHLSMRAIVPEEQERDPGEVLRLQRDLGLTRAEARVASRLAQGTSVPDIAADLGITPDTVRSHLKRIYAKTGVHRQAELVRLVLAGDRVH